MTGRKACPRVRGAMELRFRRQLSSCPPGVRRGLLVRYVDRPRDRQWYGAKHGSLEPLLTTPEQEVGRIGARPHKREIFAVGHLVLADGESGRFDCMSVEFVIPSEAVPAPASQCSGSHRDINHVRRNWS